MRHIARRGFSLIELVIVVVIIGIIAAIAIPRMSRGASGAGDAALSGNLTILRNAIDLYHTEHGGTDTDYPLVASFDAQMTQYSDATGATSPTKTTSFIYGPYIRSIPSLPVGAKKGLNTVAAANGAGVAWVYNESTGLIVAGATESDATGKAYNSY
ncbi:Type II secretion system protein G [Phycisphaerales bacterium]|nr:Type II secretion system protein G [Phycisphaerales bacterium]